MQLLKGKRKKTTTTTKDDPNHFSKRSQSTRVDFNLTVGAAPTTTTADKTRNAWLTQGSTAAAGVTQQSYPRKNLDLESAIDLASQEEEAADNPEDALLVDSLKDYTNRTHVDQFKTM